MMVRHYIPAEPLRADDFDGFVIEHRRVLLGLIEKTMGARAIQDGDVGYEDQFDCRPDRVPDSAS
jgi:hypothetical protein